MPSFKQKLADYTDLIQRALPTYFPPELAVSEQSAVYEAMQYALLGGGKRIRAVLTLACCEYAEGDVQDALPFAAAIEMVHAYSLIHDDLPCMDDDDMRRGKPACHIQFGEANALLAGDGLLTLAFETMLLEPVIGRVGAEKAVAAARALGEAAGIRGMIGGQCIDLQSEGQLLQPDALYHLHLLKTGALIRASAKIGCIVAGATADVTDRADRYAKSLGLAFQVVDDILDVMADEKTLGKPVGSDRKKHKTTFVTLYGIQSSRDQVKAFVEEAGLAIKHSALEQDFFFRLAEMLAERVY